MEEGGGRPRQLFDLRDQEGPARQEDVRGLPEKRRPVSQGSEGSPAGCGRCGVTGVVPARFDVGVTAVDLRLGPWQSALADVAKIGSVICDPPYGARTHDGDVAGLGLTDESRGGDGCARAKIDYECWTPDHVHEFVRSVAPRTERFIVPMTSHDLLPAWEAAYKEANFYAFAPIAIIIDGGGVRVLADGPANWTIHLPIARRRSKQLGDKPGSIWRSTPGGYHGSLGEYQGGGRGKPSWLLDKLVKHYSNPGHTIVDPFAGYGQTLVSARNAGRHAIGSEESPVVHHLAELYLSGDMSAFRRALAESRGEDFKKARAKKREKRGLLSLFAEENHDGA